MLPYLAIMPDLACVHSAEKTSEWRLAHFMLDGMEQQVLPVSVVIAFGGFPARCCMTLRSRDFASQPRVSRITGHIPALARRTAFHMLKYAQHVFERSYIAMVISISDRKQFALLSSLSFDLGGHAEDVLSLDARTRNKRDALPFLEALSMSFTGMRWDETRIPHAQRRTHENRTSSRLLSLLSRRLSRSLCKQWAGSVTPLTVQVCLLGRSSSTNSTVDIVTPDAIRTSRNSAEDHDTIMPWLRTSSTKCRCMVQCPHGGSTSREQATRM